jgi:hypothetical protein
LREGSYKGKQNARKTAYGLGKVERWVEGTPGFSRKEVWDGVGV